MSPLSGSSREDRHEGEAEAESGDDKSSDIITTASSGVTGLQKLDLSPASMHRASALIGRVISGRYKIVEAIATGGMGTVFRGDHLHMRKRLAIKVLHPESEDLPGLVAQFEREAIAGAHITHPNVANATDFGKLEDGSYFLILEYVKGVTLAEVLKKGGALPMARALHIATQIADALQTVHQLGIVHRDLKPGNIMLAEGPGDVAKLIDFGFAKVPVEKINLEDHSSDRPSLAKTISDPDTVFGTIGYLAPEAAEGMDAIDGRSDLYALGCILYEMLTGRKPFEAANNSALFQQHRMSPVPRLSERAPAIPIPTALEAVVMRMLEKSPTKRYQTGRDVVIALENALPRTRNIQPAITIEVAQPAPRYGRGIAIAVLLALLAGIVVFALKNRGIIGAPEAAAPSASEAPKTKRVEVDGLGASAWTARLLAAPGSKDWKGGAKALAALGELDERALQNSEVATAAAAVAAQAAAAPDGKDTAEEIYDLLAQRFGSEGLDALYTLVESKDKAGDAPRGAMKRLTKNLERASPTLKITIEVRDAPCEFKQQLFERAGAEGDHRTLTVLTDLQTRACPSAQDPCCYRNDKVLAKAIATLKARTKK